MFTEPSWKRSGTMACANFVKEKPREPLRFRYIVAGYYGGLPKMLSVSWIFNVGA